MTMGRTVDAGPGSGGHGHVGWVPPQALFIVGVLGCFLWLVCISIQLQTNEATFLGIHPGQADVLRPSIWVFKQPWDIVFSELSVNARIAYVLAWIVLVVDLIFIVGYVDALSVAGASGWVMRRFWFIISWALVIFNFATDMKYGMVPGVEDKTLGQVEFAIGMSAGVFFLGVIGLFLMRKAWQASRV